MPGLRKSVEYPKSRSPSGRRATQYPSFNVGCFLLSLPANHNRTESPTALLYSWAEPAAFSVTTVERLCFKILFGAPDSLLGVEFPKTSPQRLRPRSSISRMVIEWHQSCPVLCAKYGRALPSLAWSHLWT